MNLADAERLFHQALKLPSAQERSAFLKGACGDDQALRRQVEGLLAAHEKPAPFLPTEPGDRTVVETPSEGPGTVIGRYKLLQQIGEGGMGVVYMAEQTQPVVRKVALKIIKLGMDTKQVVARFEAERQALALMDHPNIAKVLDAGATETGRPYFVMELVRGIAITEYCDKNHLSARQRLELSMPVCQAIQHAHQKGIIHRDIKPSNILVTLHDGQPVPMVIDFGIAKAIHQRLTEKTLYTNFAQMIGTPAYMSPEQAEMSKLDVDTRTDVYSLGVLLYELLTGTTPFSSKELLEAGYGAMQRIIAEQEPPRPSTRLSTMQQAQRTTVAQNRRMEPSTLTRLFLGDLDWIVMKCLEKERGRRYETASALAADLQRHLQSEPVAARPPTAAYRLHKAIRRHRLAFAAAGAASLALVLGLATASWQAVRATQAEREQVKLREQAELAASREVTAREAAVTARTQAEEAQAMEVQQRQLAEASEKRTQQLLYAANMKLVQQAWDQNNIGRLRQLLAETETSPHRGFEWYYWQRQIHGEVLTLRGHTADVMAVAYSPDGKRILTGSRDGTAKVWDAATGRELLTLRHNASFVNAAAFSPDGRRIVTGGRDRTCRLWEASTGRELLGLKGHTAEVLSVAFSPDGGWVVSGGGDNNNLTLDTTARVWDVTSGLANLTLTGHKAGITSVAVSPDGKRIATASWDRTTKVWDASTGKELLSLTGFAFCVSFSPDGRRLVIGAAPEDGAYGTKILDSASGQELTVLKGHDATVFAVAFSHDGQRLATGSDDTTVKVWEVMSGKELMTLKGHTGPINAVAFSPDGQRLVTGAGFPQGVRDFTAKIWDPARDATKAAHGGEGDDCVTSFSNDRQQIVTVSADGTMPSWEAPTSASAYLTLTVRVWKAASGKKLNQYTLPKGYVGPIAVSPDGQRIAAAGNEGAVGIWHATTGEQLLDLEKLGGMITSIEFSPDGNRVLAAIWSGSVKVLDAATGRKLFTLRGHNSITRGSFSPDGRRVVTSSYDGTVRVWAADTGSHLLLFRGHTGMIESASFSPTGERIVSAGFDLAAKVWEAATGKELLSLEGHSQPIRFALFTPNGRRIITRSDDGTHRVWDATIGKELLAVRRPSAFGFNPVVLSSDGERILAISSAETGDSFYLSELATPKEVARWQMEEREAEERLARAAQVKRKETKRPDRAPGLSEQLIDLSAYYNASTLDDWHNPDDKGNNLASLPLGLQEIAAVRFDVRGIIQLSSTAIEEFRPDYPDAVTGIRVAQTADALHFLHGTGWSPGEPEQGEPGTEIARYVVHYADGLSTEVPIRYGDDVRNWQFYESTINDERGGAQPVWKGPQERWRDAWPGSGVRLYLKTWDNPRPGVQIERLDFVSTFTASAPFLIAITLDPASASSPNHTR